MKHSTLVSMANYYINSYAPLVASPAGRIASQELGIPPFVDGSIRREPDLEHEFPSISCLCRAGKFAPRLRPGDGVVYMTKAGRYGETDEDRRNNKVHRRLVAVLQVLEDLPSHADAERWYRSQNLPLPSNCMVHGNPPKPLEESHRLFNASACAGEATTHAEWDRSYRARSMKYRKFVVCKLLWRELGFKARIVLKEDLVAIFGGIPGTQNPGRLERDAVQSLLRRFDIEVTLS